MASEKSAPGDRIALHYTGTLSNGEQFDSSHGQSPIEFTLGRGEIVPGLDTRLTGREAGERDIVTLKADEAFGAFDPEKIMIIERARLPGDGPLKKGQKIRGRRETGEAVIFTVLNVAEDKVVLDGNHPLAGKNLTYDWEIVRIEKPQE